MAESLAEWSIEIKDLTTRQILPVIDLQRGQVVHGVAGQRKNYRPILSHLTKSINPSCVAKVICEHINATDIYVADLDAITGDEPDWNSYSAISSLGLDIWLDAGTGDRERVTNALTRGPSSGRLIVALESLDSLRSLDDLLNDTQATAAGVLRDRLVFSLDLKENVPITQDSGTRKLPADRIASIAVDAGVQSMIVLDVAEVGGSRGATTVDLCGNIKARHPDLELISGGGVRDLSDVQRFVDAGCDRVLVATALHNGAIK